MIEVTDAEQVERLNSRVMELLRERDALVKALENIAIYGCGMLSQPPAMNGPEEAWLRMRIAEYERCAREALALVGRPPTVLEMVDAMTPEELANWSDDGNCNAGKPAQSPAVCEGK